MEEDWITISEAAKQFRRTRTAIEQHIKTGRLEAKRKGPKQLLHVNKQALTQLMVSFARPVVAQLGTDTLGQVSYVEAPSSQSDLVQLYKGLLDDSKAEISYLKDEIEKQRIENKSLQTELLKLMHEMQSLLKHENGLMSWIRSKTK
jgi:hypothetical protein